MQFLVILSCCLYLQVDKIFRENCSQRLTLKRDPILPGRTSDINQKFDRSLPNLFNFTGSHLILLCCPEFDDEINLKVKPNRTIVFRG